MTIGQRIRNRRLELGLSVDELSAKLGKNRATVYRYEKDDIKELPITVLEPLAKVLGTTPADLMGWGDTTEVSFVAPSVQHESKYEIFEKLLKEKGVSAYRVAKETGVSTATMTSWKQGKYVPKPEKLQKIADYFGVQLDYLAGESEFKTKQEMIQHFKEYELKEMESNILQVEHGVRIPVLGQVAAGTPIFAQENYVEYEEISATLARTGEFFGLRIKGDSMAPKISEGDVVIVRQQSDADSGDIVIVLINGDFATCKKLMKYKDGISLISFNPSYEPMTFTEEDVRNIPVRIIGRVVENRQKY